MSWYSSSTKIVLSAVAQVSPFPEDKMASVSLVLRSLYFDNALSELPDWYKAIDLKKLAGRQTG